MIGRDDARLQIQLARWRHDIWRALLNERHSRRVVRFDAGAVSTVATRRRVAAIVRPSVCTLRSSSFIKRPNITVLRRRRWRRRAAWRRRVAAAAAAAALAPRMRNGMRRWQCRPSQYRALGGGGSGGGGGRRPSVRCSTRTIAGAAAAADADARPSPVRAGRVSFHDRAPTRFRR